MCKELSRSDLEGFIDQVYHFGQTPVCIFPKKSHPKREEFCQFNIFESIVNKTRDKNYKFKKIHHKNNTPGKSYALLFSEKKIIIFKSIENSFFISKYNLKDSEKYMEHQECLLEDYYKCEEDSFIVTEFYKFSFGQIPLFYSSNAFTLFRNKLLISGMHPSNMIIIHTLKGSHFASLEFHTSLVTCVACTSDYIISASLDSTMLSWKMISENEFVPFLTYFGHNSPISQLKVLDSYQVIVSSSIQGMVLIHDIRYSECLRKINEHVICLGLSELGIIGLCGKQFIKFYGLNAECITESIIDHSPHNIQFNYTGDYCIEMYQNFIRFTDPTNTTRSYTVKLDGVQDLIVNPFEKAIYMCRNKKENLNGIYLIKLVQQGSSMVK